MATVNTNAIPYGTLIKINQNIRRKKLNRALQDSNFLISGSDNWEYVRAPIQFRKEKKYEGQTDSFSHEYHRSYSNSVNYWNQ